MRTPVVVTLLALAASPAYAESDRGGSVGGALGRTNSGIGEAVNGGSSHESSSPSPPSSPSWNGGYDSDPGYYSSCTYPECDGPVTVSGTASVLPEEREVGEDFYTGDRARFAAYAGLQKVHDSDASGTVELSVTDYRFRLSGAVSHYVEAQDTGRTTLTLPSLLVGLRLTGRGNTQLFVDGGVAVAVSRGAPAMDTSITGPVVGAQVVHYLNQDLQLVADARAMWFDHDVSAVAGKVGIKFGHAQLSMRVLDFNVGPALWGPELGVAF